MKRSTERILTTHTGSLPRPDDLVTMLHAKDRGELRDQAAFEAGLNNEVTANGLLKLLRLIAEGKAVSQQACDEMLKMMMEQQYRSGIPAGLPKAARVAHKTGNISTVHHDAGIVYMDDRKPYVLVILTQFPAEKTRGKIS